MPNEATCRPEDTLSQAAEKMSEHGVVNLSVVADDGRVISVITDLDIALVASIRGKKLSDLTIRDGMSMYPAEGAGTVTPSRLCSSSARRSKR